MSRYQLIIFLLIAALPRASFAASFDCAKAGTVQEKMICSDSALSALDDKLAHAYRSALSEATDTKAAEIQAQQKEWLRNARNGCTSRSCLVQAYEERIDRLASCQTKTLSRKGASCPVSEKTLIGYWENVSGGIFEEMAFGYSGSDRTFNSWLHQRPEIAGGTWKIEDCAIFIRHPTEAKMSYTFKVGRRREDRI
jgi:uncharacterized protein